MNAASSPISLTYVGLMLAGAVAFGLWALSFDALLRRVHAAHHDLWLSLGAPAGWFWSPPDSSWLRGAAARQRLVTNTWIYPPAWLERDPVLRQLWRRMSLWAVISFVVPLLLIIHIVVA